VGPGVALAGAWGLERPAGELLAGNTGSLCEQHPLKAPRALLADLYLNVKYYIIAWGGRGAGGVLKSEVEARSTGF
jgi:hypothetical protein